MSEIQSVAQTSRAHQMKYLGGSVKKFEVYVLFSDYEDIAKRLRAVGKKTKLKSNSDIWVRCLMEFSDK